MEPVSGEPVSASYFPDLGENTGYLPSSGRLNDNNPTPSQWEFNDLAAEFPMQQNREDVRRNSEQKAA